MENDITEKDKKVLSHWIRCLEGFDLGIASLKAHKSLINSWLAQKMRKLEITHFEDAEDNLLVLWSDTEVHLTRVENREKTRAALKRKREVK